jgi:hypothetical protein
MHRLSRKFQLIPHKPTFHLCLCEYQKDRQAALSGLRTAKMQTGGVAEDRFGLIASFDHVPTTSGLPR